jgi:hypothetical protein
MAPRSCYFLAVCWSLTGGPLLAQEAGQDFKAKALAEWNSLLHQISTFRWELKEASYIAPGDKPFWLRSNTLDRAAYNGSGFVRECDHELLEENQTVTDRSRDLILANEEYRADLMGAKGGEGWLLTKFERGGPDAQTLNEGHDQGALPWLLCYNIQVLSWIQDPSFSITRVERPQNGRGDSPVRVHFWNDASKRRWAEAPQHIQSGHMDFDAAHSYRVTGYEFIVKSQVSEGVVRGLMEYEVGEGIPVLMMKTEEQPGWQGKGWGRFSAKSTWTYTIKYNTPVPDQELRLSYYGLPEPAWAKGRRSVPAYAWILLAAGVVGALAASLRFYVRRRRVQAKA